MTTLRPARRMLTLATLVAALALGTGATVGWRRDGSGAWPGATPPGTWSLTEGVLWSTPLPQWSNASPVIAKDMVCVCEEPTSLVCLDKNTGAVRWRAAHDIVDTVAADKRAEVADAVARKEKLQAELAAARSSYSLLLRKARAGGDAALTAELETAARRTDAIKTELDSIPEYRTPPNQDMIGWSSPTPVADDSGIYVVFANGVVAAHNLDGTQRWSMWLGPRLDRMLGWDEGSSASPALVDGVLVVPYRELTGIDVRTGRVLWTGETWPHFGAPTPMTVDGTGVVITPSGKVVRGRDGKVLAEGLADMWYVSPVVDGPNVYFLEARSGREILERGGVGLKAWRIDGLSGDTLRTTALWSVTVPVKDVLYVAPVVLGSELHLVTSKAGVTTVDAATGNVTSSQRLPGMPNAMVYASPASAGGKLFVTDEAGRTAVLSGGPTPTFERMNTTGPTRSSLTFEGKRIYVRTKDGLVALGQ